MNGDLISRTALIDSLYEHEFQIHCPLDDVSTVIDAEPAVDAEPVRHGRWIKKIECVKCSICFEDCWADCAPSYEFCPRCGAKMDGGDEN